MSEENELEHPTIIIQKMEPVVREMIQLAKRLEELFLRLQESLAYYDAEREGGGHGQ